jgi:hypothetical protein
MERFLLKIFLVIFALQQCAGESKIIYMVIKTDNKMCDGLQLEVVSVQMTRNGILSVSVI